MPRGDIRPPRDTGITEAGGPTQGDTQQYYQQEQSGKGPETHSQPDEYMPTLQANRSMTFTEKIEAWKSKIPGTVEQGEASTSRDKYSGDGHGGQELQSFDPRNGAEPPSRQQDEAQRSAARFDQLARSERRGEAQSLRSAARFERLEEARPLRSVAGFKRLEEARPLTKNFDAREDEV